MANPNIGTDIIAKGVRLTVVVEYCFENIIAVVFVHNGKEYRGVLLESSHSFFPHGIAFSSRAALENQLCLSLSPRSSSDMKQDQEIKRPCSNDVKDSKAELSAVVSRFSYHTNPFLVNPRPVQEIPTVEMKAVGGRRKTVRDIRLRPRQTLCFKCKSAIHDSHKNYSICSSNPNVSNKAGSNIASALRSSQRSSIEMTPNSTSSLTCSLRKRKNVQTPLVLLEDIQHKSSKNTQDKNVKTARSSYNFPCSGNKRCITRSNSSNRLTELVDKKHVQIKARFNRSSSSGSSNTNNTGTDWLQILDYSESRKTSNSTRNTKKDKHISSTSLNPKPSPTIKISIGDGAILKIPPRLPDSDNLCNTNHLPVPKIKILDISSLPENHSHKKAKKAAKRSKERDRIKINITKDDSSFPVESDDIVPYRTQKKHKKKHRHRHNSSLNTRESCNGESHLKLLINETKSEEPKFSVSFNNTQGPTTADSDNAISGADEENHENTVPYKDNVNHDRPRLVYTWKQNEGLSRVSSSPRHHTPNVSPKYAFKASPGLVSIGNSPHRRKNASPARVVSASPNWHYTTSPNRLLKDYPLRSKSNTAYSSGLSSETVPVTDYSVVQTADDCQSHSSDMDYDLSDFSVESGEEQMPDDFFPGTNSPPHEEEDKGIIKPLMMKIQTQNVSGCVLEEGREIRVGDIVWGKIQGFPWWPGRVSNITVTQRDNDVVITQLAKVAWFGSNTMSHMHCSDLFPFLKDFKVRYNKKKKGQYRVAIKQATMAAQLLASESDRDFVFEDFDLL
ncbi:PWWP domain-containing protein 2A-like isoform X1 [Biomphalaria glabrata]|uniref:PWWP domain-containing protein 2A-like isoform X1 n=1 Tax=Biomphalaria glabrata TaxID=6526 RepID=A0A9U8E457_BIOGL|nr:PWWP domain-containing protein 2A-like isoform X1 [Biomphalaria glabrata]